MSSGSLPNGSSKRCQSHGCTADVCTGRSKKFCYRHYRDRLVANRRTKRSADPDLRKSIAEYKRSLVRKKNLTRYCSEAHLRESRREDQIYATALRRWIKECKQERQRLDGLDLIETKRAIARINSKRRYWEDPEAHRTKAQTYKHSNPEYRGRWNEKRGKLERELSDGTLTRESVAELFARSKQCPYCGDSYKKSRRSLDHIVPLAKANGRKVHSITNVLVCCRSCNGKKHTQSLTVFLEEVKRFRKKSSSVIKQRKTGRDAGLLSSND